MDQWGRRSLYFPASQPQSEETPENNADHPPRLNGYPELTPTNVLPLASAFAGISLTGDQTRTPSFGIPPPAGSSIADFLDPTVDYLMGFSSNAELQQGLIRAHQNNGAHQNLNVGPDIRADILRRMHPWYPQLYSDECWRWNYDVANYNGLHSKEPIPQFPILPCLNQNSSIISNGVSYNYNCTVVPSNLKNNQSVLLGDNDLRGKVVALAKDQQGSKILQAKLEKGNKEEIEVVLSEVIDCVTDLLKNQSGSYVIQKLFVVCNEEQRTTIIQAITRTNLQFVNICFSQHGARAMQKLLENLSTPQQTSLIISALTPVAVALANDQSGHHVLQYCVKTFSIEYTRHLLSEIANNCFTIATQKSGCCVLQSCVEFSHGELRDRLITEILTNAVHLSEDQYGNYVVQHLVGLKLPRVTETLLERLQGSFVTLSCNKYASNVVEKIILESGEVHSTKIIAELLRSPSASMLLVDPYGNFVIQTALQVSKGHIFNALCKLIYMNSASMQSNIYGKKILDRLCSKKEPLHCTRLYKRQV
ncbi:pumilio homolog 15-like [Nicotiana sylvestris]|uniref:Pumilio homolog 12-like n=1 Tax=Nicotiana sylvestris TaxID=4096 RepID=A0A1U7Y8G6_NICSY|nr:PREDICTED: pumilio homolog 12-like [Nicotiana sylvestris]